ncbi:hypothetical protein BDY21DRAFT_201826 [Lineolata rhizophorae]|uniref:Uncharacterized protein n=1 Tax=Lineolata rhizophorae TaxID=578093 RepID=A0A6A6P549_9PEZI|nr:hypothetical protein BDY21DRAFT_201826 [Lineolata rhizophorae]
MARTKTAPSLYTARKDGRRHLPAINSRPRLSRTTCDAGRLAASSPMRHQTFSESLNAGVHRDACIAQASFARLLAGPPKKSGSTRNDAHDSDGYHGRGPSPQAENDESQQSSPGHNALCPYEGATDGNLPPQSETREWDPYELPDDDDSDSVKTVHKLRKADKTSTIRETLSQRRRANSNQRKREHPEEGQSLMLPPDAEAPPQSVSAESDPIEDANDISTSQDVCTQKFRIPRSCTFFQYSRKRKRNPHPQKIPRIHSSYFRIARPATSIKIRSQVPSPINDGFEGAELRLPKKPKRPAKRLRKQASSTRRCYGPSLILRRSSSPYANIASHSPDSNNELTENKPGPSFDYASSGQIIVPDTPPKKQKTRFQTPEQNDEEYDRANVMQSQLNNCVESQTGNKIRDELDMDETHYGYSENEEIYDQDSTDLADDEEMEESEKENSSSSDHETDVESYNEDPTNEYELEDIEIAKTPIESVEYLSQESTSQFSPLKENYEPRHDDSNYHADFAHQQYLEYELIAETEGWDQGLAYTDESSVEVKDYHARIDRSDYDANAVSMNSSQLLEGSGGESVTFGRVDSGSRAQFSDLGRFDALRAERLSINEAPDGESICQETFSGEMLEGSLIDILTPEDLALKLARSETPRIGLSPGDKRIRNQSTRSGRSDERKVLRSLMRSASESLGRLSPHYRGKLSIKSPRSTYW